MTEYTKEDVGCYVDEARGIYAVDRIIEIANEHGALIVHDCTDCDSDSFSGCEFAGEFEDEADDWMNENCPVEGCYWGRSEAGDWGLWLIEGGE